MHLSKHLYVIYCMRIMHKRFKSFEFNVDIKYTW